MKRLSVLTLTLAFSVALSGMALGQTIVNSDHDFSTDNWNSSGEICIVCHTPHNADVSVADAPLWNHEVTTATFTLYSSATFDGAPGQPDGASKLCLSCHDGTVAVNNFGGQTGGSEFVSGNELLGTDLSNDHPVSFTYDTGLATTDGGLFDPTTANSSGLGGTIEEDLLFAGKVQCATCHDVHNGTAGTASLLRISNASSALCLTCHDK